MAEKGQSWYAREIKHLYICMYYLALDEYLYHFIIVIRSLLIIRFSDSIQYVYSVTPYNFN